MLVIKNSNIEKGQEGGAEVITIVLADEHEVVRSGLRVLLEAEPDFRIVGEAADGLEAVRLVERLRPDILVTDLKLSGMDGIEVARQVSKRSLKTGIIILSICENECDVLEALQAGANAYVLKDSTSDRLVHAINEVATGHRYLSPPFSEQAIEAYMQKTKAPALELQNSLTMREKEVLEMVAKGYTNAKIAAQLFISPRTVETHRANVMRKLNLENHIQLIHYVVKQGLLVQDN
jgi:two-component system response regulator NreC